jgi:hypothetical protein
MADYPRVDIEMCLLFSNRHLLITITKLPLNIPVKMGEQIISFFLLHDILPSIGKKVQRSKVLRQFQYFVLER